MRRGLIIVLLAASAATAVRAAKGAARREWASEEVGVVSSGPQRAGENPGSFPGLGDDHQRRRRRRRRLLDIQAASRPSLLKMAAAQAPARSHEKRDLSSVHQKRYQQQKRKEAALERSQRTIVLRSPAFASAVAPERSRRRRRSHATPKWVPVDRRAFRRCEMLAEKHPGSRVQLRSRACAQARSLYGADLLLREAGRDVSSACTKHHPKRTTARHGWKNEEHHLMDKELVPLVSDTDDSRVGQLRARQPSARYAHG